MGHIESEIKLRVSYLDGEKKNAVLDYIRDLNGKRHSSNRYRRNAMRQIRNALEGLD